MKKSKMKKLLINIDKATDKLRWLFFSPLEKLHLRLYGIRFGKGLKVNGKIYIKVRGENHNCTIGNNVRINSSRTYNPIGGIRTNIELLDNCRLSIGSHVGMSNVSIVCAEEISIGDYVNLGDGVKIFDTDFHSVNPFLRKSKYDSQNVRKKRIEIGEYAFIGANSIILKGSTIGNFSVVGAGSVVAGTIPDKEIWAGNPARFIRKLTEAELMAEKQGQASESTDRK